jgi:hypothetical protein
MFGLPAGAQRVDPAQSHYRIRAIDRVITDAKGVRKPAHADGKLAFVAIYRGNSNICLVEYVALKHEDFDSLRTDAANDGVIKIFDKARSRKEDVATAGRAAGFAQADLDKFFEKVFVRVP